MEMSVQLHVPAALPREKEFRWRDPAGLDSMLLPEIETRRRYTDSAISVNEFYEKQYNLQAATITIHNNMST
jgi:hypothetical protein